MQQDNPQDSHPDPQAPDSPEAEASPPPAQAASPPPVSRKPSDPREAEALRQAKRKEHLDRALKAAGRAPDKADEDPEAETKDETDEDPDAPADETPEEKSARLARVDKLKSHKHIAKEKERLSSEAKTLDQKERDLEKQRVQDQRINDAVTREYAPMAKARIDYQAKDYRSVAAGLKNLLGDDFPTIARNIWNATKDGMATADLKHQVQQLEAKIAERDGKQTEQATTAKVETEGKQLRASFDKRVKGHALMATADEELIGEAFDKWRASWDEDLEEYSISAKKAADMVHEKHLKRAERLTGKRRPAAASSRETKDATPAKPRKDWTPEEKKKFHLDRALRERDAANRERQRHA